MVSYLSTRYNLESHRESPLRDCLLQGGLWVCLEEIVLIALIDVERPTLNVDGTF